MLINYDAKFDQAVLKFCCEAGEDKAKVPAGHQITWFVKESETKESTCTRYNFRIKYGFARS